MGDSYDDAAKKLGQVAEALHSITDAQLFELGHAAVAIIVNRTGAGIDVFGQPFAPYAEATREQRQERSLQVEHVDLAQDGHMLGAASVFPAKDAVTLGFNSPHEAKKAAAHHEGVRSKRFRVSRAKGVGRKVYRTVRNALRRQRQVLPERRWFDVGRIDREAVALTEMVGFDVAQNIEKTVSRK